MEIIRRPNAKRGAYRASYDHTDLVNAYHRVLEDHIPVQRAALLYGVPITTLKDRVRGKTGLDSLTSGPQPLFSQEQESLLTSHLITMAEVGYGYSRRETVNLASDYAVHLGIREEGKPLSLKWLYNFVKRWPTLKVQKPRSLEAARARCATKTVISNYFTELQRILTINNLTDRPGAIYNIDEKGLSTDHKPPKIVSGSHYKAQAVTSGKSQTVTVIGGANALGNQVPPFFIFPGKRMVDSLMEGATAGAACALSDSGWSNTDIFARYMKEHLLPHLPARDASSPVLVLYDGHKSHVSLGLIEWARNHHIILFVLPPHCSHLLQPLDVSCFGPFEVAWNSACHTYLRENGGKVICRHDVCKLACKVYTSTLTPSNVQAAFRKCGIHPFNSNIISDHATAPSLAFPHVGISNLDESDTGRSGQQTSTEHGSTAGPPALAGSSTKAGPSATAFLEKRGGKILENVQTAKVRNTLSKVVGGKAITEDSVLSEIKNHMENQVSGKRKRTNKAVSESKQTSTKKKEKENMKTKELESESEEETEMDDHEICCVCRRYYPKAFEEIGFLKTFKWAQCDKCDIWVHLRFCTSVKVLRIGDKFCCPLCAENTD